MVKPRLIGLDVLRMLAVTLVLGRHMGTPPDGWDGAKRAVFDTWNRGGWVGVDLFFVLSGFLVSGLLFTEYKARGRLSPGRFYIRRGWKIYPPFWTLIAATVLVSLALDNPVPMPRLAAELTFLQSYFPGWWAHTWSLAVEEHFYFLLPIVLLAVLRVRARSAAPFNVIPVISVWVAVIVLTTRLLNWYLNPSYSLLDHFFASHLRLDALFFGVAISYAYHFHTPRFVEALTPWRRVLILIGLLLLVPAFAYPVETTPFIFTIGLTLFFVGSGLLMVGMLLSNLSRRRSLVLAATLGAYSYSIYLWHLPVRLWGVPLLERAVGPLPFAVDALIYVAGSIVAGVVMAKLIEWPALRLRDRWFPARDTGAIESLPETNALRARSTVPPVAANP